MSKCNSWREQTKTSICPKEHNGAFLFLRDLNLTVVDLLNDGRRMLSIHSAANRITSSQHLLHSSSKLVSIGTLTENLSYLNHLIKSDVSTVLNYTLIHFIQSLLFLSFLRSLGGSFSSRMIREEALGTTSTCTLLQSIHTVQ